MDNPEENKLENSHLDITVSDISEKEKTKLIIFSGKLDVTTVEQANNIVIPLIEERYILLLDLSKLSYLSSTGLGFLMKINVKMINSLLKLRIIAPRQESIYKTLDVVGMVNLIQVCNDLGEAVKTI